MTTDQSQNFAYLGPTTEARFAAAFAVAAVITAKAASELLGLDVETLSAMTDDGVIRAVRKGRVRSYTERDLRTYLIEGPDARAASDREPRAKAAPVRTGKVVPFSARKGAKAR
ncbi:helix-turn-helix domain-containing protein [Caulobacter endophyticus]|uniref:Helix-turn-helix domain-containing protein n=1 Tax=Caulobacter endophyticus TaxID=2172652 RepID=A0A2T9K3Y9_9CAUL|nr:helix-turn-helix domain-containing protein [Caulobacter endophyticus]PVM90689.1 hypothetical protein DDF67_09675 [Caulobacter endophyticus]